MNSFRVVGLTCALVLLVSFAARAQWSQTNGLYGGDVYSFASSGTNLFAGTQGGVFLSSDNGTSWNEVSTGLYAAWAQSLAVSDTYLFAGSGAGSGVFLSPTTAQARQRRIRA